MLENYRNRVGAKYFGHSRSRIETPKDRTRIRRGEMLKTYRNQVGAKYFSHSRLLPRLCAATQSASFKVSLRLLWKRIVSLLNETKTEIGEQRCTMIFRQCCRRWKIELQIITREFSGYFTYVAIFKITQRLWKINVFFVRISFAVPV